VGHGSRMYGSNFRRLARLGGYLAGHPADIPRYLRNVTRRPLEVGLPWLSYAAVDFLANWVKPHHTVFEWGPGGSTLFFARRAASVTSIESNEAWLSRLRQALAEQELASKVDLRMVPYVPSYATDFIASSYCSAIDSPYDIILVDGEEHWPRENTRPSCAARADQWVKPGAIIVVDDTWRYDIPPLGEKERRRFKSVGPCRPGVTTIDIFF
jgi:hypothetical protein